MRKKVNAKNHLTTRQVLYALLIGTSLIMVWRGVWGLLDIYFFPNDKTISLVLSVVIGILILSLTRKIVKELT